MRFRLVGDDAAGVPNWYAVGELYIQYDVVPAQTVCPTKFSGDDFKDSRPVSLVVCSPSCFVHHRPHQELEARANGATLCLQAAAPRQSLDREDGEWRPMWSNLAGAAAVAGWATRSAHLDGVPNIAQTRRPSGHVRVVLLSLLVRAHALAGGTSIHAPVSRTSAPGRALDGATRRNRRHTFPELVRARRLRLVACFAVAGMAARKRSAGRDAACSAVGLGRLMVRPAGLCSLAAQAPFGRRVSVVWEGGLQTSAMYLRRTAGGPASPPAGWGPARISLRVDREKLVAKRSVFLGTKIACNTFSQFIITSCCRSSLFAMTFLCEIMSAILCWNWFDGVNVPSTLAGKG